MTGHLAFPPSGFRAAVVTALLCLTLPGVADDAPAAEPDAQAAARKTAVALNYCRSAFYRIRRTPTGDVLREEQAKILNNLNLSGIDDEEVIHLYSAVLDEIGQVQIAGRERRVVNESHDRAWQSMATLGALGAVSDAADLNYANLLKKGASSWWDYRGMQISRDLELWKTEKARLTAPIDKSGTFLDASWKLARKRNIPDAWLVRNGDLERLDDALHEADPAVRLRRLARMESFLEYYPPYWYYVGRTQQQAGRFLDAEKTYQRVAQLGTGHFRRDEMLAASWANVAAIRDFLEMADAQPAAELALACSADAWQVNLTAAGVLLRHGALAQAEDAVLRNLDAGLETTQSNVALLAVYAREQDPLKILIRLDDETTVARTPIPVLLGPAAACKDLTLPRPAVERLRSSLYGYFEGGGGQDFVLVGDAAWELDTARFAVDQRSYARPLLQPADSVVTVSFRRTDGRTASSSETAGGEFHVVFKYADDFEVKLTLRRELGREPVQQTSFQPARMNGLFGLVADRREQPARREPLRIAVVEAGGTVIAFDGLPPRSAAETADQVVFLAPPDEALMP